MSRRRGWQGRVRCRKCGAVWEARLYSARHPKECHHAGACGGRLAVHAGQPLGPLKGYAPAVHEPSRQVEMFAK